MENLPFLIAVLACPLGMLAMGGIAWVSGKAFRGRSAGHEGDGCAHERDR